MRESEDTVTPVRWRHNKQLGTRCGAASRVVDNPWQVELENSIGDEGAASE
jgi:hypothetical protein